MGNQTTNQDDGETRWPRVRADVLQKCAWKEPTWRKWMKMRETYPPRYPLVSSNMACWKPWTILKGDCPIFSTSIHFGDFPAMELMTPEAIPHLMVKQHHLQGGAP